MATASIQWYPGHIAKAQQQLRQQLQRVDVILEVVDARIPLASRHPELNQWAGEKPCVLVFNRKDQIPVSLQQEWREWFRTQAISIWPTNAQSGEGVAVLRQHVLQLGTHVNQRRQNRGMRPRPIRAVVVGFPNVGKSALLNRLLQRRVVDSARRPGVTRSLRWVRLGADLDLLDAPGIIPPQLNDQEAALKLAICEDIGDAAYVPEQVAAAFLEWVPQVQPEALPALEARYQFTWQPLGSLLLATLASQRFTGDERRAALQILVDFRKGALGPIALERPPAA
ncbi:MAG: ribosome biogenesis GTPase YlqF [Synechococcaceae cyanobacterium SM2_3_1]|nr:ribosome biogenesis GTPase YlqF [Synechococcaceae cyanobacterium SM2_3_1]